MIRRLKGIKGSPSWGIEIDRCKTDRPRPNGDPVKIHQQLKHREGAAVSRMTQPEEATRAYE